MSKKVRHNFTKRDFQQGTRMGLERRKRKAHDFDSYSQEIGDSESKPCSVASTRNFSPARMSSNYVGHSQRKNDFHADDCQSSYVCDRSRKEGFCTEEEVAAEVHEVELYAYFSVLRVLYASGPLSWDQEALLTNLRLSLNISNEEHLYELKGFAQLKLCKLSVQNWKFNLEKKHSCCTAL